MRLPLLFVLALGLAAALPQEGRRGSRRFSLASPGLLKSNRGRVPTEQNEETAPAPEQEVQETPSVSPPRRSGGRSFPRVRSRTSPRAEPSQEPTIQEEPKIKQAPTKDVPSGRGARLRLRRPLKKVVRPTTTTTTTTTITPAPEPEPMMDKPIGDKQAVEPKKSMPEEVIKKKIDKTEVQPVAEKEQNEPVVVSEAPKIKISKGLPRPQLRPIPIKIGSRGGAIKPKKKAVEPEAIPQDQESTPVVKAPAVSSHRFSSRQRGPRIQLRGRGSRGRKAEVEPQQEEKKSASQPAETEPQSRTRGRGSSARRFSRISPRGRTSAAAPQDTPAEETLAAEEAAPTQAPQRRFPNLKELKTIAGRKNQKSKSKQRRRKIGVVRPRRPFLRPQRPTKKLPIPEVVEEQTRVEELPSKPLSSGPPSDDAQKRQQKPQVEEQDHNTGEKSPARPVIQARTEQPEILMPSLQITQGPTEAPVIIPVVVEEPLVPVQKPDPVQTQTSQAPAEVPVSIQTTTPVVIALVPVQKPDPVRTPTRISAPTVQKIQAPAEVPISIPVVIEDTLVPIQNPYPVRTPTRISVPAVQKSQSPSEVPAVSIPEPVRTPGRTRGSSRSQPPRSRGSNRDHRENDHSTQLIGTVEDTPRDEVNRILSGLGSRRRGLARSKVTAKKDVFVDDTIPSASTHQESPLSSADYLYDYYDYLNEEALF